MRNMKSAAAGLYFGLAAIILSVSAAQAALISVVDPIFGVGSVTRDTVNGVEWLDLSKSDWRTYTDVSGQFGPLGDFAGWRHATLADLEILFTAAGYSLPHSATPATAQFNDLMHQLGLTISFGVFNEFDYQAYLYGMFDDGFSIDPGLAFLLIDQSLNTSTGRITNREDIVFQIDGFPVDDYLTGIGHWLIRDTIPEPASLVLFGSGVLLLVAVRRRYQMT